MYLEEYQPFIWYLVFSHLNIDDQVLLFNNRCCDILDIIALQKLFNLKRKSQPWMNSDIWALRQQCRQCERKCKKDGLKVSYKMLKASLHNFQKAAKIAKAKYLSEIIAKNSYSSRILFSTIDSVLKPSGADIPRYFFFIMWKLT